jgi:hypothetical protein
MSAPSVAVAMLPRTAASRTAPTGYRHRKENIALHPKLRLGSWNYRAGISNPTPSKFPFRFDAFVSRANIQP